MATVKSFFAFLFDTLKVVVLALVVVIPIRYFLFQPFFVIGQSMEPNFDNGDYLLVDELSYRVGTPHRGDVIVFNYPKDTSQRFIKRIVGLPGETVSITNGKIMISKGDTTFGLNESAYLSPFLETIGDVNVTLGPEEFFVLGDNRPYSYDSRKWGTVPRKNIIGKVFLKAWPLGAFAKIDAPLYQESNQ